MQSASSSATILRNSDSIHLHEATIMEFSKLIPLPELHDEYKESFDQTFSNDEDLLKDAFSYGPFHEEEFRFGLLATHLSDLELTSLFLPVGHVLVRGSSQDQMDRIEEVRRLYAALIEWQSGQLKDKQQLIDALAEVRSCVFRLAPGLSSGAISFFRVLELGINARLGMSPGQLSELEQKYNNQ
jgi:hypothetical protein